MEPAGARLLQASTSGCYGLAVDPAEGKLFFSDSDAICVQHIGSDAAAEQLSWNWPWQHANDIYLDLWP